MYITWVQIMAEVFGIMLHVALCMLIVFKWNMDIKGLGIAYLLTNLAKFLFVTCYSNCPFFTEIPLEYAFFMPTTESLKYWNEYIRLSLPATILIWGEAFGLELLVILSGLFGVIEQSTMVIMYSFALLMLTLPLGVQEASC